MDKVKLLLLCTLVACDLPTDAADGEVDDDEAGGEGGTPGDDDDDHDDNEVDDPDDADDAEGSGEEGSGDETETDGDDSATDGDDDDDSATDGDDDDDDDELIECPDPTAEPNEAPGQACRIPLGTLIESRLEEDPSDAQDCYGVLLADDTTYTLTAAHVQAPASNRRLYVEVISSSGTAWVASDSIPEEEATHYEFGVSESGPAFICLTSLNATGQFDYDFRIDPDYLHSDPPALPQREPNNSASTAVAAGVSELTASELAEDFRDYVDCYRTEVEQGVEYSMTLAHESGPNSTSRIYYKVHQEQGGQVLLDDSAAPATSVYADFVATVDGNAILCVSSVRRTGQFDYDFRIDPHYDTTPTPTYWDETRYEPNNSPVTAYAVGVSSLVASRIEDDIRDTKDCYRAPVQANVDYALNLATKSAPTNTRLYLTVDSASGDSWLDEVSVPRDEAEDYTFRTNVSEDALICIRGLRDDLLYEYDFRLDPSWEHEPSIPRDGTQEPNDTFVTAAPLALGQNVSSQINPDIHDQRDCYRTDVVAGGSYLLEAMTTTAPTNTRLYVEAAIHGGTTWLGDSALPTTNNPGSYEINPTESGVMITCIRAVRDDELYRYELRLSQQ